jgi:alpha-tubulin suppressor-like RCC1 family protein
VEVPFAGLDASVVDLSAGVAASCARFDTGDVYCWQSSSIVPMLAGATQVASAFGTSFAIQQGGTLFGWGGDGYSELGDDRARSSSGATDPVAIDAGPVSWIRAGGASYSVCAGAASGDVLCWGGNMSGQLAAPWTDLDAGPDAQGSGCATRPTCVPAPQKLNLNLDASVAAIAPGPYASCVALSDGHVKCFGNENNILLGASGPTTVDIRLPVDDGESFTSDVAVAGKSACARLTNGHVMCWGLIDVLGRGSGFGYEAPGLVLLEDGGALGQVTELRAGNDFACARVSSGEVYCWGDNVYGELGDPAAPGWFASRVPLPN